MSIYISPAVRYLKKPPTRLEQRSGCLSQTPDTDSTRHSAYKPYSRIFNHSTCSERFSIIQVWAAEAPAVVPLASRAKRIDCIKSHEQGLFLSLFLLLFLLFNIILNPGLPIFYPSSPSPFSQAQGPGNPPYQPSYLLVWDQQRCKSVLP